MEETTLMQERKKRILAYMESEEYRPMKRKEMRTMLSVPAEDKEKFDALLNELLAEGHICGSQGTANGNRHIQRPQPRLWFCHAR